MVEGLPRAVMFPGLNGRYCEVGVRGLMLVEQERIEQIEGLPFYIFCYELTGLSLFPISALRPATEKVQKSDRIIKNSELGNHRGV